MAEIHTLMYLKSEVVFLFENNSRFKFKLKFWPHCACPSSRMAREEVCQRDAICDKARVQ